MCLTIIKSYGYIVPYSIIYLHNQNAAQMNLVKCGIVLALLCNLLCCFSRSSTASYVCSAAFEQIMAFLFCSFGSVVLLRSGAFFFFNSDRIRIRHTRKLKHEAQAINIEFYRSLNCFLFDVISLYQLLLNLHNLSMTAFSRFSAECNLIESLRTTAFYK